MNCPSLGRPLAVKRLGGRQQHPAPRLAARGIGSSSSTAHRSASQNCTEQQLQKLGFAAAAVALSLAAPAVADVSRSSEPGTNLGFLSNQDIDKRRLAAHFKRAYDGHVALENKQNGDFMDIKCDLQVPGTVLLRAPSSGQVYILSYQTIRQIDLSDDDVVSAIASDSFEKEMVPIEAKENGSVARLQLSREGFYSMVTIIDLLDDAARLGAVSPSAPPVRAR